MDFHQNSKLKVRVTRQRKVNFHQVIYQKKYQTQNSVLEGRLVPEQSLWGKKTGITVTKCFGAPKTHTHSDTAL